MTDINLTIDATIKTLEGIQSEIGRVQITLLDILTDDVRDAWDQTSQKALIKLEAVQRAVGEIQVDLLHQMTFADRSAQPQDQPSHAQESTAGTWLDPHTWLAARGITVRSAHQPGPFDAAADRIALYLGDHFATIAPFYEALKRRASGGYAKWRWFPVRDLPKNAFHAIFQFGTMLHSSGFLSTFEYLRKRESLLFDPQEDGHVQNFLTGGWLERYVAQLARHAVEKQTGAWHEEQVLRGAQLTLPDQSQAEFDLLLGLADKVLWIECKTGDWQTYARHFKTINEQFLHLPASQTALVLIDKLDAVDQASNGELTSMTVLDMVEFADWLSRTIMTA
ncbi:MAG: hypothetical protein WBD79_26465 [Anaerolineae bacterium]